MTGLLAWLATQAVTIVIASVTSAITVVALLSRVFTRLATVENSLLGAQSAEEQVAQLRVGISDQLSQLRTKIDRHEIDDNQRLDKIDGQYATISLSVERAAVTLEFIKQSLEKDREDMLARLSENEIRQTANMDKGWKALAEINLKIADLQCNQYKPPTTRRRK